jgi:glycosyltransferase involved in cell wall biosynthesis
LIKGFGSYLKDTSKPGTLVLAGPDAGGLKEIKQLLKYKNELGGKVILAGEAEGYLKYSLFVESSVVCLLSKSETIPVSLVEAASFGKPIICSKECNLQSLVDSGGAVLSTREPGDISRNLEKILDSEKVMINMGMKSKDWFKKNYDSDTIFNRYKEIYDNA